MKFFLASHRRRTGVNSAARSTLSGAAVVVTAWAALQAFRLLRAMHRRVDTPAFSHAKEGHGRRLLVVGDGTGVGIGSFDSRSTVAGRLAAAFPGTVIVNRSR